MPGYQVIFSDLANKKFEHFIRSDRKLGEQIAKAIDRIAANPAIGEFLRGNEWKGLRKYRTGNYRIIYRIEHSKLLICLLTIDDRKSFYQ